MTEIIPMTTGEGMWFMIGMAFSTCILVLGWSLDHVRKRKKVNEPK